MQTQRGVSTMSASSIALICGAGVAGLTMCFFAVLFDRRAKNGSVRGRDRAGLYISSLVMIGCVAGFAIIQATTPLTEEQLAQAKWSAEEWQEVAPESGIFRIPDQRKRAYGSQTLER